MQDFDTETLHNLLADILRTHIIAIIEQDGQTTVHVVCKEDKVDIAVTMRTWLEALVTAVETLQETRLEAAR